MNAQVVALSGTSRNKGTPMETLIYVILFFTVSTMILRFVYEKRIKYLKKRKQSGWVGPGFFHKHQSYEWVCSFCSYKIKRNQPIGDTYCPSCAITRHEADKLREEKRINYLKKRKMSGEISPGHMYEYKP